MTILQADHPSIAAPVVAPTPTATPGGTQRTGTQRPWEARYVRKLVAADLAAAVTAGVAGLLVRFGTTGASLDRYVVLSALLPFCWLGALSLARAYETRLLFIGVGEYQYTLRAGFRLMITAALASYALNVDVARGYFLLVVTATTVLSMVGRVALRRRLHQQRAAGTAVRRVLAVGSQSDIADLSKQLSRRPHHGLQVVAACVSDGTDGAFGRRRAQRREPRPGNPGRRLSDRVNLLDVPVLGDVTAAARAAVEARADTVVILSVPELGGPAVRRLAWALEREDVELIMAASLLDVAGDRIAIRPVDGLPLMHIEHPRLTGGRRVLKLGVELVGALILLALLAPVLLVVAGLVKLDSKGPVLFRQTRIGRHGREFPIFKFRTMHVDAEQRLAELRRDQPDPDNVLFKLRRDPRVTRVGRVLRRYSLDELPQILNVLFGHMSLVGPRPPLAAEVANYPDDMRRRLVVRPGMTGLWQVSGRSDLSWEESVRLDLQYVENWSLSLDLMILARTVAAVVRGSGAY